MKLAQEHFEECLSIFLCNAERYLTGDTALNLEVQKFIAGVCSEKVKLLSSSSFLSHSQKSF